MANKIKRTKILIDSKFQLRTVFAILGIKIVIISVMVSGVGVVALYQNKHIANVIEIEDNIVQVLAIPSVGGESDERLTLQMAQNHDANMKRLRAMIMTNQLLIWGMVAVIFIQGVILFFVLIRYTHRIAGPVYVMSLYLRSILNGKFPEYIRPLRENDFLKDFYALFTDTIIFLREKYVTKTVDVKVSKPQKATKSVKSAVAKAPQKKSAAGKKVAKKALKAKVKK